MSKRRRQQRWRKIKKHQITEAELRLQSNERWCMNACSRYLTRNPAKDTVWTLLDESGAISALIVYVKQNLLPVLCGQEHIPPPHFLRGFFGAVPVHALQGRMEDVGIMEAAMKKIGFYAVEKIDYDLMCIDEPPSGFSASGPAGLVIRKPQFSDMDSLVSLQAAYEQEEVLPARSTFNPAVSRLNTEKLFTKEQMLVAELGGQLIGKINTNAVTFTRYQVGGVYVHPDYRGLGIARRMAGEFIAGLTTQSRELGTARGISLFVKKSNPCARRVYQRIGFSITGDYRISYY
ncbi:MAG: GNAT family N-acetyltransferase [Treponema sp.]|nr:GNAT family N-acetyltransferase [Treponema sp.]